MRALTDDEMLRVFGAEYGGDPIDTSSAGMMRMHAAASASDIYYEPAGNAEGIAAANQMGWENAGIARDWAESYYNDAFSSSGVSNPNDGAVPAGTHLSGGEYDGQMSGDGPPEIYNPVSGTLYHYESRDGGLSAQAVTDAYNVPIDQGISLVNTINQTANYDGVIAAVGEIIGYSLSGGPTNMNGAGIAGDGNPLWGPHGYTVDDLVCSTAQESSCTLQNVFSDLLVANAPRLLPGDMHSTYTGDQVITPFGIVSETVDSVDLTVTNTAVSGEHLLAPGSVNRQVVQESDGIHIITTGTGNGMLPGVNEALAPLVWGSVDNNISIAIQAGVSLGQSQWSLYL